MMYLYNKLTNKQRAERIVGTGGQVLWKLAKIWMIWVFVGFIFLSIFVLIGSVANARNDYGQFDDIPADIKQWFENLKQPDTGVSCCGQADAYYADEFETTKDGRYIAIITDNRDNEKLHRTPVENGAKIIIPQNKLVDATIQHNPTGHGILYLNSAVGDLVQSAKKNNQFVAVDGDGYVYCFVPPSGF